MSEELSQKRQPDLQDNIRQTLELIKEYEEKRRLSDEPKQQRDSEHQLADLRRLLQEYGAELTELQKVTQPI